MKIFKPQLCAFLIFLFSTNLANATIIDVNNGTTNISTLSVGDADTLNFVGHSGTLAIDIDETLTNITTSIDQKGTVDFSGANALTATGDIGTSTYSIRNITFNDNGTLTAEGNIYTSSLGITTTTNNQGNLTLSGTVDQAISSAIGSSTLRLNTVSITQGSGTITFSGNVFATNLATSSSGSPVTIDGTGGLDFTNSAFNQNTSINSSGTNSFGATTIANAKTLTLNSDSSLSTLTFGTSGNMVIASGKTTTITGNVSGTGLIKGNVDGAGNILFSGSAAQSVASTVQLGDGSDRLNKITSSNTHGLTLSNDVYTATLDFSNTANTATATIASGKTIDVSGNITQSGAGTSVITGAGKVSLSGSTAQAVASGFGSSTSDRLGELEINNTGGVTLNKSSYLSILRSTGTSIITNNGTLDTSAFDVDETATISGSGTNGFGATTIADAKTLTLNSDASLTTLTFGTSGNIVIASGKTATITGDISGTGLLKGSADGAGNILFSGSLAQSVASNVQLGDGSDRLNKITSSNTSGLTLDNDVYATTLDFSNASGIATATIVSGKTIDVSGNITQSGAGTSVITGTGVVSLTGSSAQTVSSGLGSSTSDRLGELVINNSAGATLDQNAFLTTLTQTSGALTINSGKTVDVTNAIDLSGRTLGIEIGTADSLFGKIKSGAAITISSGTTINFDYSNNSLFVNHDGTTQFNIAESTSGISGTVSDITVTDNSFLFNNTLVLNGNNIASTVSADTTNFNINTLGADNFNLLNNALTATNLTAGIISITSQQQLENDLKTLKPATSGALTNTSLAISDDVANATKSHLQQINSDIAGFSADHKPNSNGKIWGQVFGGRAEQREVKDGNGYNANTNGIMFGSDHMFKGETNVILGGALSYGAADINSTIKNSDGTNSDKSDKNNISSYQLTLYNNNSNHTGLGFYNNNIISAAYNQYKSTRNIIVGSTSEVAKASFGGRSYSAKSDVGYNFKLSDKLLFSPNVGVRYFLLQQDSYQETNAGNDGLNVKNKNFSDVASEIGFNLTSKFADETFNYIPKFSTSWKHSLTANNQKSTYSFIGGGTEMQSTSVDTQKNKFNFGLALNISDESSSSVQLQYNLQLAQKFVSNGGSIQYRYVF